VKRHCALLVPAAAAVLLAAGCGPAAPATTTPAPTAPAATARTAPAAGRASAPATPACREPGPQPPGDGSALAGVQFVSAETGWAVVGADRILGTRDGGRHWATEYRTAASAGLSSVDFVDAAHGWVAGASVILATANGGRTWRALPEPCPVLSMVHFVSPVAGFAVSGAGAAGGAADGGGLLATSDGGRHWRRLSAPADAQSACFSGPRVGWLGAAGGIYGTRDGGRTWTPGVPGGADQARAPALARVQCAGNGAAWAEVTGPGAAMSQAPHIGYHTAGGAWAPIFAEQYFGHPGAPVTAQSPGSIAGPFSAVSATQAVFIDVCTACGYGTAPMDAALDGGSVLQPRGNVGDISDPLAAAFVTLDDGWVIGTETTHPSAGPGTEAIRIVHTADGGRSWQVQYSAPR
jgi:photosystem II stability/assembly factor-like uncharacterized protein